MPFMRGILFGMVLQLSVGPVFFAVLNQSVARGFREAFKMALGVTVVDAAYIMAAMLGISQLLNVYYFRKAVLIGGAAVLIYFGLAHLLRRSGGPVSSQQVRNSFGYGVKLTLTNPLTVVFWSSTFGSLLASGQLAAGSVAWFAAGCVSATVLFLCFVSAAGSFAAKLMTAKTATMMDRIVGLFLIIFGASLLWR